MKICKKCNVEKKLSEFCFRKYKNTYRNECKECKSKYNKQHRTINKDSSDEYRKKYYSENSNKLMEYGKKYYCENKNEIKTKGQIYYKKNKNKIINRNKNYILKRRKNDSLFRLLDNLRSLIRQSIVRNKYNKNSRTVEILGCSVENFKSYIESKWESWMTWDNYGMYDPNTNTWQLDHIIPVSSAKTEEELIKLNYYTNFQPLLSIENILKSNKL